MHLFSTVRGRGGIAWLTDGRTPLLPASTSVLDLTEHGALRDGAARLGGEAGDRAGFVGGDRVLHLHRLEDDDEVTRRDRVAVADRHLDDRALHGRGDR